MDAHGKESEWKEEQMIGILLMKTETNVLSNVSMEELTGQRFNRATMQDLLQFLYNNRGSPAQQIILE